LGRIRDQPADGESVNRPDSRALLAFAACTGGALAVSLVPTPALPAVHAVVAGMLLAGAAVSALAVSRRPASDLDVLPALLYLAFYAVLRDATGGHASNLAPMTVLPLFWVALYGNRRQLGWIAGGLAVVLLGPLLVGDDIAYPRTEWRRALVWLLIITVLMPIVQRAVHSWVERAAAANRLSAELDAVMDAAAGHAIISTDTDGRVRTFSEGAELMLGHRAEDVCGRPLELLHDPFDLPERLREHGATDLASWLRDTRSDHRTSPWVYLRANGTRVPVEVTVSAIRGTDGAVTGYTAVATDVAERLDAARRLEQDERRWRLLLERLPDTAVLLIDEDLRYRQVVADMTHWQSLASLPGEQLGSQASKEIADQLLPVYHEALHGGTASAEVRGFGGDHVHQVHAVPVPGEDGRREALLVVRDVTRDRRREKELLAANERIKRIFDATPYGGAVVELDGTITAVNPRFEVITGRSDLVGRSLAEVLDVAQAGAVADHLEALLHSADDRLEAQWATRTRAGTTYLAVSSVLLRTPDGEPEHVLLQCVDDSARHQHEQQLTFLANHDTLTGLLNRRSFDVALRSQVELCQRYGPDGAVLMVDLDGFKEVNDRFGHAVGDRVLVDLAEVLRDRLRATDVVARLGGDEFAVLLPRTDRSGALEVAESIRLLVRSTLTAPDGSNPVSASIGIAMVEATDPEDLLRRADRAMYSAKHAGRDCLVLADA
jgi:diguanylate cyclase (GGDEF)-like protein/PAS domain S-box-containing protein